MIGEGEVFHQENQALHVVNLPWHKIHFLLINVWTLPVTLEDQGSVWGGFSAFTDSFTPAEVIGAGHGWNSRI